MSLVSWSLCPGSLGNFSQGISADQGVANWEARRKIGAICRQCPAIYLNDTGPSFQAALKLFKTFGDFPGICINWSKSVLFPLDDQASAFASPSPLRWVTEFCYLGIQVTRDVSQYYSHNHFPCSSSLRTRGQRGLDSR